MSGKIFGIGLSGTGTKSLVLALRKHGYSTVHLPRSIAQIAKHQAAADLSVACRYRELDVLFPESRFILTVREKESWLDSRSRKPPDEKPVPFWMLEARLRAYGRLSFDEAHYRRVYDEFHEGVSSFFSSCPERLLTIEIGAPDAYQQYCEFIGREPEEGVKTFPRIRQARTDATWLRSEYKQKFMSVLNTFT